MKKSLGRDFCLIFRPACPAACLKFRCAAIHGGISMVRAEVSLYHGNVSMVREASSIVWEIISLYWEELFRRVAAVGRHGPLSNKHHGCPARCPESFSTLGKMISPLGETSFPNKEIISMVGEMFATYMEAAL